jgi:hypothetical protein
MFNKYIEEVDRIGLLLQHTLPEQSTLGNEYNNQVISWKRI